MAAIPADIMAKIKEVTAKPYHEQAIWYLNAFWSDSAIPASKEAEEVWQLVEAFVKEDHVKGKNGNELNPIQAFHVLQARNQTLTALELKAQLRKVDIDANGEMALVEYLLFNFRDQPHYVTELVTRPQGAVDPVKLQALQDKLNALDAQFQQLQVQLEEEKSKVAAAKVAEENAIKQEAHAKSEEAAAVDAEAKAVAATNKLKAIEDELRAVEEEARAIEAEIKAQEKAKLDEMARLEALTQDQSVGIVKRNMAVQQLATLKNEDSLPLQKAKLTQEAVVRRLAKVTKAAADETAIAKGVSDAATAQREAANAAAAQAVAAREAAVAATAAAEESKKQTEIMVAQVQEQMAEVEKELKILQESDATPQGLLFWEARKIEDKKRSLPQRMW